MRGKMMQARAGSNFGLWEERFRLGSGAIFL